MTSRSPRTLRPVRGARDRVHLRYLDADKRERRVAAADATEVCFEDTLPARTFSSYAGQWHTPGKYWAASTDRVLGYESFLESKWMKLLDFDADVAAFSAQPFLIEGVDEEGLWVHTPDLFVRRRDGSALVVDVKHDERIDAPAVVQQARRTEELCARIGWDYAMVGEPAPLRWATVSWLAGYRRPLGAGKPLADPLLQLAREPVAIGRLVSFQPAPELARSVVYHLLWHHQLVFDPTRPLRDHTAVRAACYGGET
ncbi:TnsA-like heteromeric transposase endonuclease subunit [Streptomyces sp. SP2-10]|uniref:TnsA-like heteromeric transposase endonuclease subunit n=1 Tax=Streptomyces sp. SP2-10 TaxID=2873385 RepID=UPI001CA778DC|nr:TnsA-like heteromeric transposase endonuclease subunit [Streptomyces sp. SP2-10]MBY8841906.1 TnsA-like heteromeric transposase endonuclease subunit [Streptomyces sp. SP2-10]